MRGEITRGLEAFQYIVHTTKKKKKLIQRSQLGGIPISKGDAEGSSVNNESGRNTLSDVWERASTFQDVGGQRKLTMFCCDFFL